MNKHVSKFTLVGISVPVPTHSVCISDIDYTNIGITISVLPKNEEVFKFGRKKWFRNCHVNLWERLETRV